MVKKNAPLIFNSNFDCGNGDNPRELEPDYWRVELHGDLIYGPWYYFEFRETTGLPRNLRVEIRGIPNIESITSQADRPVFKINNNAWQVVPSDQVRVIQTDQTKKFEEPLVWFWERGEKSPLNRYREFPVASLQLNLKMPAKSSLKIATTYPYTYERLLKFVSSLNQLTFPMVRFCKTAILGKSEESREIPMVTLTDPDTPEGQKQIVILTARHHPAMESSGSWVIEGIINYLLSLTPETQNVLSKWIIVAIPMVNVDGVYHGNPHYNIKGVDLVLDYQEKRSREIRCLCSLAKTIKPDFFIDFHGWICHHEGSPPYDGAYFDVENTLPWDSGSYERMINYCKKEIRGFGGRAVYPRLFPQSSVGAFYDDMHTLGCILEINPGGYSIEEIQGRAIENFQKILELMDEVWPGYPQRGVPHRDIIEKDGVSVFAGDKDYQELRENRVYLWKRRKKVKLIVIKKGDSQKCIIESEETIGCKASLRFKLRSLEEKETVKVKINGKEVTSGIIRVNNWIFVPVLIGKKPLRVEIQS
jgi:hypothetical protein